MWRERAHAFFKCVLSKVHFYNIIPFIGLGKSCYNFTASVKLFILFSRSCSLFDISSHNCFFLIYGFVALETWPFKVFHMYLSSGIAPSVFIHTCIWLFSLFVTQVNTANSWRDLNCSSAWSLWQEVTEIFEIRNIAIRRLQNWSNNTCNWAPTWSVNTRLGCIVSNIPPGSVVVNKWTQCFTQKWPAFSELQLWKPFCIFNLSHQISTLILPYLVTVLCSSSFVLPISVSYPLGDC